MAKYVICVVKDAKALVHSMPLYFETEGLAIRSFQDEVNRADEKNAIYRYPEDFRMYVIGEYDSEKGDILTWPQPELLVDAASLKL